MVLDSANEQLDEDDVIESLLTELQERSKRYIQTVLDVMNYYNLSNIVHFDLGNLISNDLYEENCNDFNFSKKIFNNLISLS
jgi:hypothetical protein